MDVYERDRVERQMLNAGPGVAVAARLVAGSLGSDTGGSIRCPASATGVTGLQPTWSRVSRRGVMPMSPSLDVVGPLARTAADCARLLARTSITPSQG